MEISVIVLPVMFHSFCSSTAYSLPVYHRTSAAALRQDNYILFCTITDLPREYESKKPILIICDTQEQWATLLSPPEQQGVLGAGSSHHGPALLGIRTIKPAITGRRLKETVKPWRIPTRMGLEHRSVERCGLAVHCSVSKEGLSKLCTAVWTSSTYSGAGGNKRSLTVWKLWATEPTGAGLQCSNILP